MDSDCVSTSYKPLLSDELVIRKLRKRCMGLMYKSYTLPHGYSVEFDIKLYKTDMSSVRHADRSGLIFDEVTKSRVLYKDTAEIKSKPVKVKSANPNIKRRRKAAVRALHSLTDAVKPSQSISFRRVLHDLGDRDIPDRVNDLVVLQKSKYDTVSRKPSVNLTHNSVSEKDKNIPTESELRDAKIAKARSLLAKKMELREAVEQGVSNRLSSRYHFLSKEQQLSIEPAIRTYLTAYLSDEKISELDRSRLEDAMYAEIGDIIGGTREVREKESRMHKADASLSLCNSRPILPHKADAYFVSSMSGTESRPASRPLISSSAVPFPELDPKRYNVRSPLANGKQFIKDRITNSVFLLERDADGKIIIPNIIAIKERQMEEFKIKEQLSTVNIEHDISTRSPLKTVPVSRPIAISGDKPGTAIDSINKDSNTVPITFQGCSRTVTLEHIKSFEAWAKLQLASGKITQRECDDLRRKGYDIPRKKFLGLF